MIELAIVKKIFEAGETGDEEQLKPAKILLGNFTVLKEQGFIDLDIAGTKRFNFSNLDEFVDELSFNRKSNVGEV